MELDYNETILKSYPLNTRCYLVLCGLALAIVFVSILGVKIAPHLFVTNVNELVLEMIAHA